MHILLCHERFLFRFGADRVLILLGMGLRGLGHRVTVLANRYDADIVESFASEVVEIPAFEDDYLNANERTVEWLRRNRSSFNTPDVVIVGGWPFLASIDFFREICGRVLFIDFGVVPSDGYDKGMQITLEKLRRLRRENLPFASAIAPISGFIATSQSTPDTQGRVEVRPILLGADHMESAVWRASAVGQAATGQAIARIRELKKRGGEVILSLGRWEPGCYKNSDGAFEVLRSVRRQFPNAALAILADSSALIPPDLKNAVYPLGFPDDSELQEIMREADLGISVSRWEGFNLPLAEMQWLDRPALAFFVGAHPEVVLDEWFLCRDSEEMPQKACDVLAGSAPDHAAAVRIFRERFTWDRYVREVEQLFSTGATILIDVSNAAKDPGNSGVIRVTRRMGRALQSIAKPHFVVWDPVLEDYISLTSSQSAQLSQFSGPEALSGQPVPATAECLLLPETLFETYFRDIRRWAKARAIPTAAIFYDAIPVLLPDLCNEAVRNNHRAYMTGLAGVDTVFPISEFSASCLRNFWQQSGLTGGRVTPNLLPGEFAGGERTLQTEDADTGEIRMLCVSTLEPRKNHRNLIRACQSLDSALHWTLTLVGNRYDGASEIAEYVEGVVKRDPRIRWLGVVDDPTLHRLYRDATFTVYPSFIEGFGMPILESLWHGRPCICHEGGVMAELAEEGGCMTVDVTSERRLSEAIHRMATDRDLRSELSQEAIARPMKTWDEYAQDLLSGMTTPSAVDSERILYPGCLTENWQMNDSERLGLTAVLARLRPAVSIEIGTYHGGSLSLISQFSQSVFSIDIDPEIPDKLKHFDNVSFLTGKSSDILPHLLVELDASGMSPEFILIDGDHSAEGIRRDIACLVSYVPKKPLIVMLHDSFNPRCREGMLTGGWERSPHVHRLETDFIPGRIVENEGPFHGQMWGGLALAFMQPAKRQGELVVTEACRAMFQCLLPRATGNRAASGS